MPTTSTTAPELSAEIADLFNLDAHTTPVTTLAPMSDTGNCTNDTCTNSCLSCGCTAGCKSPACE
jgi:hypothetical protein